MLTFFTQLWTSVRTGLKQLLKIWFIIRRKNIAFAVMASKAFLLN